ncbi:helix-turn-helix transcriptional regulator [Magnetospirillum sp. 15-1]|uniref:helix-turn-helix domain-containing protein n=1 Tax=Magnetospirillum sp. 15-1 TaxID=1979370 RepID=UPI001F5B0A39|nr:helix-turn-helix transcriptional regulator [Magnetospirillum sp. 15-1]
MGANVKKHRLAAGLSQEELALRVEIVDQGYISGLEIGKRNPTILTIWLVANALGLEPGQLFSTAGLPADWTSGPIKIVSRRTGRSEIDSPG